MKRLPQCWSSNGYCPQWVAGVVAWPHTRQLWSTQGPFSVAMLPPGLPPMPGHTETVGWRAAVGRAGLGHPWCGQCPPEHEAQRQILPSPVWNLDLQVVFNSKNEFYCIKMLRTWFSSLDLHIFLPSRLLLSDTVKQRQVCGRFEGTSVMVRALPWPRSNSFQNLCFQRTGNVPWQHPGQAVKYSCQTERVLQILCCFFNFPGPLQSE